MNVFLPLLHRQTFEKLVAEGLHHTDPMFGGVLLLVCAHGARYSDDPRVLAEGSDSPRSSGWRWFEQVNVLRKSLFRRTTLYELQLHAVSIFLTLKDMIAHRSLNFYSCTSSLRNRVRRLKVSGRKLGLPCAYRKKWVRIDDAESLQTRPQMQKMSYGRGHFGGCSSTFLRIASSF
jgi:hypothetical protein